MPRSQDQFDVVIVGSGAGGGMAAYMLTRAGARVAVVEAGPMWWPDKDSAMWTWNYSSPRRGAGTRLRPFGEFDAGDGGWDIEGEPYTVAAGQKFDWYRGRMLGGRTNHWGRISLRFGPRDFRRRSLDGLGDDWPIGYDDVKPYYDASGPPDRHLRQRRGTPQRARRHLPAPAEAALLGEGGEGGGRRPQDDLHPVAALDPHPPAQRPRRLPLLRPVQPGLHGQLELLLARRAAQAGAGDGPAHHHPARDGAGGDGGRPGAGARGGLRRQDHRRGPRGARPDRRAGGQRLRVGAAAAQLDVVAVPERARERQRRGGQVPHRHRRQRHGRVRAPDARPPAPQLRWRGRRAPLLPLGARQPEARFPPRLPHRDLGRPRHARRRAPSAESRTTRSAAATGSRSRTPAGATTARRSASTAGASRSRTSTATARSTRTSWTSGASRCSGSTGSGPTTRSGRRSTCRRPSPS